jgi:hypothetical protein
VNDLTPSTNGSPFWRSRVFQFVLAVLFATATWYIVDQIRRPALLNTFPQLAGQFSESLNNFRCNTNQAKLTKLYNVNGIYREDASDHEGFVGIRIFSHDIKNDDDGDTAIVFADKVEAGKKLIEPADDDVIVVAYTGPKFVYPYKNFDPGVEQSGISGFLLTGATNCSWAGVNFEPGPIFFMGETGKDIPGGRTAAPYSINSCMNVARSLPPEMRSC